MTWIAEHHAVSGAALLPQVIEDAVASQLTQGSNAGTSPRSQEQELVGSKRGDRGDRDKAYQESYDAREWATDERWVGSF